MDTGKGYFKQFENDDQLMQEIRQRRHTGKQIKGIFCKGEILKIKNSRFSIRAIGKREMRLRLLKDD